MKFTQGHYTSGTFTQRKRRTLTSTDGLLSDSVNCLLLNSDGVLFAGTSAGLCVYKDGRFVPVSETFCKSINALTLLHDGSVAVCMENELYIINRKTIKLLRTFEDELVSIADARGMFWIITKSRFIGTDYSCKNDIVNRYLEGGEGVSLAVNDKAIYAATDYISVIHGKRREWKNILPRFSSMPDCRINSLCFDDAGYLWIGTQNGAAIHDNGNLWLTADKIHTLPKNEIYKIVTDKVGGRYFASDIGVIYQNKGGMKYFSADRWVPSNKINDIAVTDDGRIIYAATDKGISEITSFDTTLLKKAMQFEENMEKYHIRRGYTAARIISNYDIDSGYVQISDNDGSWTGCYVAAESFRYAATGDKEALEKARRGMKAMLLLAGITKLDGFTARAVRYPGEVGYGDGNHEWVKCDDEECEWKCETSSDEMTTHFFALSIYYDLCADEKEKEDIKNALCAILDHIVRNNYRLIDHDGLPTTWACWDPEMLNHDDKWFFERGINSLELLGFFKVCYHISGDEKYNELYNTFVSKYAYPLNAVQHKVRDAHICHIDDNLAFLASVTLLRLEDNEAIRSLILCGMEDHWQYERVERQPLFCFIHAAFTGRDSDLLEGIQSLREIPFDLIHYASENSKRKDIILDTEQEEWHEPPQALIPLPYDERNLHRPDASVFELDTVDRGESQEGTLYLLPYWFARYYGLLDEE